MSKASSKNASLGGKMKTLVFVFSILLYSVLHMLFLRLKLPGYGAKIGSYLDDVSYAMIVAFILVLIFNLPSLLRKLVLFFFILSIQFLVFAEWWNYEFYRDYIRYASLGHATDFQEIARGFQGFENRYLALVGVLFFLLIAFVLERQSHLLRVRVRLRFLIVLMMFLLALMPTKIYINFYKLSQIENWYLTTAIPLNYKNPVLQLFREKLIDGVEVAEITPLHIEKINQLYDAQETVYPFYDSGLKQMKGKHQNIIFLVLESVRKYETIPKNGIDLTPNFNKIAANNFTPKFYYANSNQTIKAEIALLCGMHDFLIGTSISAANNQQVKTNCLPEILKHHGYRSYWFHGAESNFFNRDKFLPKMGFDELHDKAVIQHALNKQGKPYTLRHWGIEDPYTFNYALKYLEKVQQPFLAEILSLSNHHPFVDMELNPNEDYFHSGLPFDGENVYSRYQHMTHYTDKALGRFWQEFEKSNLYDNTIVVISGDHGVWIFPDEVNYDSSAEAAIKYETYLRLPLTIYFPGQSFSRQTDIKLSQVDVPGIIANHMELKEPRAFQSKLNHGIANQLFGNGAVPADFANPVFSLIGDNFYYRNLNILCYPPIQTSNECDDYLRRCIEDHNVLQTDKTCIVLEDDILTNPQVEITPAVDYDIRTPNTAVDYFRKSIYFGAMPEAEILSQNN